MFLVALADDQYLTVRRGVARNPEAKGAITTTMILGMALVESIAIYGLVIAFILLYANPFKAALGM